MAVEGNSLHAKGEHLKYDMGFIENFKSTYTKGVQQYTNLSKCFGNLSLLPCLDFTQTWFGPNLGIIF